jgi:uncharacterized protein
MATPVTNKETLLEQLLQHKEKIRSFGVQQLGLFGSFKRNDAIHATSDVDLLVEFAPGEKTYDNFMELSFYLEDLLGRKVELVTPQSLSKHIGPHILKQVEHVRF